MIDDRLLKGITVYALDDFLRYKLGKRLVGTTIDEEYEHFVDAVSYLSRRPTIRRQLAQLSQEQMIKLLQALEDTIK